MHVFHTRSFFFFNDTATTEIYTLSLHDALPILLAGGGYGGGMYNIASSPTLTHVTFGHNRSEEHTSELQSRRDLVCRLLLEKKNRYATPTCMIPQHLASSRAHRTVVPVTLPQSL